jgi:aldehyde dehydrogenase (NAD+)
MAMRRPLGVVGGIAPFNFPLILATKKVAFALAAGNTFVLKPSEETSLVGLKIAEIFDKAGLPPGVLNVVPGDGPTLGAVLYSDPRVKAILFTGSTAVGRQIGVECAKRGKKFDLEMGGQSPFLVMKDANLEYAVDTARFGLFIHQGQICMAGSRVIVEKPAYEQFLDAFVDRARSPRGRLVSELLGQRTGAHDSWSQSRTGHHRARKRDGPHGRSPRGLHANL